MSIDDKLDEISIWIEANRDVSPRTWEDEIWPLIREKLKQLFADEGYLAPGQYLEPWKSPIAEYTDVKGKHVIIMSGQEWYDRFEKEFENSMSSDPTEVAYFADKAAKKASRLDD